MNESLTTQSNALQLGGMGLGAAIFKARPAMLELVQPTSRAEGAQAGQFRDVSTNEYFGNSIRVVLLAVPQIQREWFDGKEFTKDSKKCFSLDGIQPHPNASQPPALFCATCPKGNLNWQKWRVTKDPKDLPPCGEYYHLLLADRNTQRPAYLNVKGASFTPFKRAMETQLAGLLAKLMANVRAENKKRGYTFVVAENRFVPTPGFVVPEGSTQGSPEPLPNLFDVSFSIKAEKKGAPYIMNFGEFMYMKAEDRAEFGNLFLELQAARDLSKSNAINEEAEAAAAVAEAAADAEFNAPTKVTQQEILPPITI
jgi:hypothetical protein